MSYSSDETLFDMSGLDDILVGMTPGGFPLWTTEDEEELGWMLNLVSDNGGVLSGLVPAPLASSSHPLDHKQQRPRTGYTPMRLLYEAMEFSPLSPHMLPLDSQLILASTLSDSPPMLSNAEDSPLIFSDSPNVLPVLFQQASALPDSPPMLSPPMLPIDSPLISEEKSFIELGSSPLCISISSKYEERLEVEEEEGEDCRIIYKMRPRSNDDDFNDDEPPRVRRRLCRTTILYYI